MEKELKEGQSKEQYKIRQQERRQREHNIRETQKLLTKLLSLHLLLTEDTLPEGDYAYKERRDPGPAVLVALPARRCYVVYSRTWHDIDLSKEFVEEIQIGLEEQNIDGTPQGVTGIKGELFIRWYQFSDHVSAPQLECYDDSWWVLAHCQDLLAMLASLNDQRPSPDALCHHLNALGYSDRSARTRQHLEEHREEIRTMLKTQKSGKNQ
jgi:hypothetical protein